MPSCDLIKILKSKLTNSIPNLVFIITSSLRALLLLPYCSNNLEYTGLNIPQSYDFRNGFTSYSFNGTAKEDIDRG